jgi:hypothetical protein
LLLAIEVQALFSTGRLVELDEVSLIVQVSAEVGHAIELDNNGFG